MASLKPVAPIQINKGGLGDLISGPNPAQTPPAQNRSAQTATDPKPAKPKTAQPPTVRQARPRAAAGYVGGRLRQVGIRVDEDLGDQLEQLAGESGISLSSLLAATLYAGLPADVNAAAELVLETLPNKPQRRYYGPRLPVDLKDRLDELTSGVKAHLRAVKLADVVNGALRSGLPASAAEASSIHDSYQRAVIAEQWASARSGGNLNAESSTPAADATADGASA